MAEMTFGDQVRQLRQEIGRSQTEQAEVLCDLMTGDASVTRSEVSRYERGERVPRPPMVRLIARSLAFPEKELLRAAEAERARRRNKITHGEATADNAASIMEQQEDDPVNRRRFLSTAALGVVAATEPWERLAFAIQGQCAIDSDTVQQLTDRSASLFEAEEHVPARQLYSRLVSHVDTLAALLPSSGSFRTPLLINAGETASLAGWLAFDMGKMDAANHYYAIAMEAAGEAGYAPGQALVLTYMSYAQDNPTKAAELLQQAQQHVRGIGCATARSWAAAREAEELASAQDQTGALRALDRSRVAYDYGSHTEEQAWVKFFRPARLEGMSVATYGRLNHPALAQVSQEALASLTDDDAKTRAIILADVATAYVDQGDLDQGIAVAREALEATRVGEVSIARQRLSDLVPKLTTTNRASRQLSDELRAILV